MRKDVKRARLWIINNLNQRAKKLCNKKGTEEDVSKNGRKAARYRSEIQVLKHIDIDEVSKFALCNQHEMKTAHKDMDKLDTEQRALLRLAGHKFVQNQVIKFQETHSVPPDQLVLLFRSLGLQYQKKKLKKMEESEEAKEMSTPPEEIKVDADQPKPTSVTHKADEEPMTNSSGNKEDAKEQPTLAAKNVPSASTKTMLGKQKEKQVVSQSKTLLGKGKVAASKGETDEKDVAAKTPIPSKEKPRLKVQWPESKPPAINKKVGTMEIKQLHLEKLTSENFLDEETSEDLKEPVAYESPLDSFFIGGVDLPEEPEDEVGDHSKSSRFARGGMENRRGYRDRMQKEASKQPKEKHGGKKLIEEKKANKLANLVPLGKTRQFGATKPASNPPTKTGMLHVYVR